MYSQSQFYDPQSAGQSKLGTYLREAETARLLRPYSWRAKAAKAARAWADRLEPPVAPDTRGPSPRRAY